MELLFNSKCWIDESHPEVLKTSFQEILETCDFEILGFMEHHFSPHGYTCIWLLGESHLAVHTYPEYERAYIELTSCVQVKNKHFDAMVQSKFSLVKAEVQ